MSPAAAPGRFGRMPLGGLGGGRPVEAVAGAEGPALGAKQDHPDLRVGVRLVDGARELVAKRRGDGVVLVGPAQDDAADSVLGFGAKRGVGHRGPSVSSRGDRRREYV